MKFETIIATLAALFGGSFLGYFIVPKKVRVEIEQKIREELREENKMLRADLKELSNKLLIQAYDIGQLRAEVEECKKHRLNS